MFPRPRFYFWRIAPANKSFLVLHGSGGWGLARSSVDACGDSEVTVQGLKHVHPCGHVRQLLEIRDRGEPGSCHTRDGPPCAPGSVQGRRGKEATSARGATGPRERLAGRRVGTRVGLSLVSAAAGLRESHDDVVTGGTLPAGLVVNAEARGGDRGTPQ